MTSSYWFVSSHPVITIRVWIRGTDAAFANGVRALLAMWTTTAVAWRAVISRGCPSPAGPGWALLHAHPSTRGSPWPRCDLVSRAPAIHKERCRWHPLPSLPRARYRGSDCRCSVPQPCSWHSPVLSDRRCSVRQLLSDSPVRSISRRSGGGTVPAGTGVGTSDPPAMYDSSSRQPFVPGGAGWVRRITGRFSFQWWNSGCRTEAATAAEHQRARPTQAPAASTSGGASASALRRRRRAAIRA
jgi:hypothetical protein